MININFYRVFYLIVKYNRLSEAAKILNVSQPSVSTTLSKLEKFHQCTLIVRHKRGITLTKEGKILYQIVSKCMNELEKIVGELAAVNDLNKGTLVLSGSQDIFDHFIIHKIEQLKKEFPNLKIKYQNSDHQIYDKIDNFIVDIAFMVTPIHHISQYDVTPIAPIEDCIIVHQDLPIKKLDDLLNYQIASTTLNDQYILEALAKKYVHGNIDYNLSNLETVDQLVKNKLAIGFSIKNFHHSPEVKILDFSLPKRYLCIVTHKNIGKLGKTIAERFLASSKP